LLVGQIPAAAGAPGDRYARQKEAAHSMQHAPVIPTAQSLDSRRGIPLGPVL
jgi:hypothetical protein